MRGIFDNAAAFAPFFDETVAISGSRPGGRAVRQTAAACVIEDDVSSPYAEAVAPSGASVWSVTIRIADWLYDTDPEPGDAVEVVTDVTHPAPRTPFQINLKVSTVTRQGGWYILKCREKGAV